MRASAKSPLIKGVVSIAVPLKSIDVDTNALWKHIEDDETTGIISKISNINNDIEITILSSDITFAGSKIVYPAEELELPEL